jgi:hypothetical protein
MRPPPANATINRLIALSLLLLVFSGTLGLGAVWVRQEISAIANRSRALEARIAGTERGLDEVNALVAAAVNPDALLRQNEVMRLGLVSPQEAQIRRVDGSPELRLAAKRNREIFNLASAPAGDHAPEFRLVTAALR